MSKPVSECLLCGLPLPDNESVKICYEYSYSYHLKPCTGIIETSFKKKSEIAREEGRCSACKKGLLRSQSVRETKPSEVNIAHLFNTISKKLEIFTIPKGIVDGIRHLVQMMSDQYDEILTQLTSQNVFIKDLQTRVEKVESSKYQDEISQLKDEINKL